MDDDVDTSYPSSPYGTKRQSFSLEDENSAQNVGNQFAEDGDNDDDGDKEDIDDEIEDKTEEEEEDEDEDDDDEGKGVLRIGEDDYDDLNECGDEDDDFGDLRRHPKKRKLKALSNYEFAPRVQALPSAGVLIPKPSYGGRNPLTDWTEHETFILLDAWGERFLKHGRKSLRSEEWQEVAEKVSQESKIERTDTQCRNRLDTLKKKYKKEKMKLGETGESTSKWACYKKMDMLLSSIPQKGGHLSAVDSGENLKDHLNYSNGLHETRDSPDNSISAESVPPKKTKKSQIKGRAASFKRLADSIQKFVGIYEKIENSKRERMLELEKMRMDFHRDLELQKKRILEKSQAEIAKIRKGRVADPSGAWILCWRSCQNHGKSKVLVKVHPEGKYVVDIDKSIDITKTFNKGCLRNDSYVLHLIFPRKVDPPVKLMNVEKVPDSIYDMMGCLYQHIKEIKE